MATPDISTRIANLTVANTLTDLRLAPTDRDNRPLPTAVPETLVRAVAALPSPTGVASLPGFLGPVGAALCAIGGVLVMLPAHTIAFKVGLALTSFGGLLGSLGYGLRKGA